VRLLLDTHTLVWFLKDAPELSATARDSIELASSQVFVSAVNGWEIATKANSGKWPEVVDLVGDLPALIDRLDMQMLPITLMHALHAGSYPLRHRDPFDRILVAQAQIEGLALVTIDRALQAYGIETIW
jgi:PIN domain nuclease of toxin-antitoxin system